jgi:hypothetical protein
MLLKTNMTLQTFDLQLRLNVEFSTVECLNYKDELVPAISFELNDSDPENGKKLVPDETSFNMSVEDAKVLHSWLGTVLNNQ